MMKKYFSLLFLPIGWLLFSMIFFWVSPELSHPLMVIKFHAFLTVYACFLWAFISQEDFYLNFFRGLLALYAGISLDFFLIKSLPDSMPDLFFLSVFLSIYLFFLMALKKALQKISSWHALLFLSFTLFSFGNIFFLKNFNSALIHINLYINPLVLTSLFFPGYDYIRGKFFYEIYPVASYMGLFRYPDKTVACMVYMGLGLLFYFFSKKIKTGHA